MAISYVRYSGDGSNRLFAITFPYLQLDHIFVTIDGVEDTSFTFITSSSIQTSITPSNGSLVEVRRVTETDPLVDFTDGSTLTESDLDIATLQAIYIAQEAEDIANDGMTQDSQGRFDALSKKIVNLLVPTEDNDAANKSYVDNRLATDVAAVESYKDAAETAQSAAESAQSDAESAQSAAESAQSDAETAQSAAESARDEAQAIAEGVSLPVGAPPNETFLIGDGTTRVNTPLQDTRTILGIDGRYSASHPYISIMDRLKAGGLTPEMFSSTGVISVSDDAAPYFRDMFAAGISDNINKFRTIPGQSYTLRSPDPSGTGQNEDCIAVLLTNLSSSLYMDFSGSKILGVDSVRPSVVNPGALFRFESSDTVEGGGAEEQIINIRNSFIDLSAATPASPGVQGIGGWAFVGRFNVHLDNPVVTGGITTPSGDNIGTGGVDQAFFSSNTNSFCAVNTVAIGCSDNVYYFSNSGVKGALILGGWHYRCYRVLAAKRFASMIKMIGAHTEECDVVAYNPTSDSLDDNMGGEIHIHNCLIEKTQSRPIDINAKARGSSVIGNRIVDWGRRISDGAENSISEQLAAIRVRSPDVKVNDNVCIIKNFTNTTTVGKEQIGLNFGYNGDVSEGAVGCSFQGNTFHTLYRAVDYDSNTSYNKDLGNNRVSISQQDVDGGDNFFPLRLVDDTMITITPSLNRQVLVFESQVTGSGAVNGMIYCNTTGAPSIASVALQTSTNITLDTGVTSVVSASDGDFTVSCNSNGTITVINRTGQTRLMRISPAQN